jgi:hypothetical protein
LPWQNVCCFFNLRSFKLFPLCKFV